MVQALEEPEEQVLEEHETHGEDIAQAIELFRQMNSNVNQVNQLVDNMIVQVKNGQMSTDNGLNFLEVKYHMLLSYLINLTYVILRQCSGQKIENVPAIDRLIELRTFLEKIRPINHKLKYQIDKLVKQSVHGVTKDDPESFKANPEDLMDEEEEDDEKVDGGEKSGLYVPPKLAPLHYAGDLTRNEQEEKLKTKRNRQASRFGILQQLTEEYLDTPVEVSERAGTSAEAARQEILRGEREEYEETYLTRLPTSKADRLKSRKSTTIGQLGDEITSFKMKTPKKAKRLNNKTKKKKFH